jgi:hypothetical protein
MRLYVKEENKRGRSVFDFLFHALENFMYICKKLKNHYGTVSEYNIGKIYRGLS